MARALYETQLTQSTNPPASRRWSPIQRLVSGLFAIYWGLILPFICWGAWATPGHPHSTPHFVFFEPLHAASQPAPVTTTQLASLVRWLGSLCSGMIGDPPDALKIGLTTHQHDLTGAPQSTSPATEPASAGRSTPTLAIMLLVIVIPLAAIMLFGWRRYLVRIVQMPVTSGVVLPIPTPPPRPFITAPA